MKAPLKSSGEKGIFNKFDWVKEADSKLISAKLLRENGNQKTLELESLMTTTSYTSSDVFEVLTIKDAAYKSSVLMLGYALELLLKSGVVSLLISAPKDLLEKKVRAYSHNLVSVALDLGMKLSKSETELLKTLSSYIINETRYPVTPESVEDYCNKTNEINGFIANDKCFCDGLEFYSKLKKIINDIDGTPDNMKIYSRMELERDGYIIFRVGGSLPPVIIVKYCQTQIDANTNTLGTIKELLINKNKQNMSIYSHLMESSWDAALFFNVSNKQGLTRVPTDSEK
ncbi:MULTISPECIES: hypothetical protein [unclassified Vibrio]|uniref:hypothetical protein n=1 Tax=unclassified Vibrio TaxID=2614977 RepID=UPI0010BD6EC2|nr:hypothetical protein [Vibrio sp. F13]TKG02141.1 hypothetical protein FCV76_08790 [Vibrio sp. F13]